MGPPRRTSISRVRELAAACRFFAMVRGSGARLYRILFVAAGIGGGSMPFIACVGVVLGGIVVLVNHDFEALWPRAGCTGQC